MLFLHHFLSYKLLRLNMITQVLLYCCFECLQPIAHGNTLGMLEPGNTMSWTSRNILYPLSLFLYLKRDDVRITIFITSASLSFFLITICSIIHFPKRSQTTYAKLNTHDFGYSVYMNGVTKFMMNHVTYEKISNMKY